LYVFLPGLVSDLEVELVDERGQQIASTTSNNLDSLPANSLLYGVVSSTPGTLSFLETVTVGRPEAGVAFLRLNDLPEVPAAWNALDVLVIHDVDTAQFTASQLAALESWVATGGQLVVAGGPNWPRTTATLARLLPVALQGTRTVTELPALQAAVGVPFRDEGPFLVSDASLGSGEALVVENGLPLLSRKESGQGAVYFLALDPALAPLDDWDGSPLLWSEVAASVPTPPPWGRSMQDSYAATNAVTSLPSLALPSTLQLLLFLGVYVVVIGPVNYLILRRLHRRELAWVTIPALVLLFSGAAYLTGFQLKGNDIIINQMSVVYGAAEGDDVRAQSLLALYSPRRRTYQVQLPQETMVRPFDRSSGALAGGGNSAAIERNVGVTVKDVRVDIGGFETMIADSHQPGPALDATAGLRLGSAPAELTVNVRNEGQWTLENVVALFGTQAFPLGDLEPGADAALSERLGESVATASGSLARPVPVGPGGVSPVSNVEILLGSGNYFNDPALYPRWQLLQALSSNRSANTSMPSDGTVTLVAWSEEPQVTVSLADATPRQQATSLYFLEVPLTDLEVGAEAITLPRALLDWRLIEDSGTSDVSPTELLLSPSSGPVAFEFSPWPAFEAMEVTALSILLEPASGSASLPELEVWDWEAESWIQVSPSSWGEQQLKPVQPLLSTANAVRVRLVPRGPQSVVVQNVFPLLSGRAK
ncbi:MAG: hypothetical protein R3300_04430, partial [Candidatus Promineifilaceae bacterium]|nr:hypothetical protein [Candidatus Promineifilaceae bacterium]